MAKALVIGKLKFGCNFTHECQQLLRIINHGDTKTRSFFIRELDDSPIDAVFQNWHVEIDQESNANSCETHVRQ